ncbi:hypothetical protein P3T25_006725 [Paraburkholderia sp. GAS32]
MWLSGQTHCRRYGAAVSHKDSRSTMLRTVYGKVAVKSPRLWSCACQPLSKTLTGLLRRKTDGYSMIEIQCLESIEMPEKKCHSKP